MPPSSFTGAIDEVRITGKARYGRGFTPKKYHVHDADTLLLLRFDVMDGKRFRETSGNNVVAEPVGAPKLEEERR